VNETLGDTVVAKSRVVAALTKPSEALGDTMARSNNAMMRPGVTPVVRETGFHDGTTRDGFDVHARKKATLASWG
ncbi:unnamed protein product, partial [Ilex paraguariensis]